MLATIMSNAEITLNNNITNSKSNEHFTTIIVLFQGQIHIHLLSKDIVQAHMSKGELSDMAQATLYSDLWT